MEKSNESGLMMKLLGSYLMTLYKNFTLIKLNRPLLEVFEL